MLPNRLIIGMTKDATVCIHCLYGHCMFHALIVRLNFLMDTKNIYKPNVTGTLTIYSKITHFDAFEISCI